VNGQLQAGDGPVVLRPLTETDFTARYLAWFADPEVTRFLDARDISREDAIGHLRHGIKTNTYHIYAICDAATNLHVGNLKIGPMHHRHKTSDLITIIGDRAVWGRGFARAAIRQGIDIAFHQLDIRKLSASIDSRNTGSIKAYTAAGFVVETSLKDHFIETAPDGDVVFSDKVYVACLNPRYKAAE